MKAIAFALLLGAASALAADLTGKWSGSFNMKGENGKVREDTAHMELKLDGQTVTGTAGPKADRQWQISKGRLEGTRLTFEVQPDNGPPVRFDLQFDGTSIKGSAKAEEGDMKLDATVDLKKLG